LKCTSCGRTFEDRPILFSSTPLAHALVPRIRQPAGIRQGADCSGPSRTLGSRLEPWASEKFEYFFDQLVRFCRRKKIPTDVPWSRLPAATRRAIFDGSGEFVGVLPFLENMREKTYKKYARFFTRRYLAFRECRSCDGDGCVRKRITYTSAAHHPRGGSRRATRSHSCARCSSERKPPSRATS
jgi:excinuclease UvrABC ATPase subunit